MCTEHLGYYDRYHRSICLILKGLLVCCRGVLVCCGGEDPELTSSEQVGGEDPESTLSEQANLPRYVVSAVFTISFTAH